MVCWKLAVPAILVLVDVVIICAKQADTRERNGSMKKPRTTDGISSLLKRDYENLLPETDLRSLKLQIKKTVNTNGFTKSSDLCKQKTSPECKEFRLKQSLRKPLKLRRQRTKETQGATRTLIIVKGNQEISREYIKQHHGFKPVLRALKQRIETLKARKKEGGLKSSPANATNNNIASLRHVTKFPNLYLVRSASRDTEGGKKQDVLSTAYTEVTDARASISEVSPYWEIVGTIHTYEAPKKIVLKPQHNETLPEPYKETPLSTLPLYDDRVLKKATSGLKIFVKDSNNDKKYDKHSSLKTLSGVTSAPSSGLRDVTTPSSALHDVTSGDGTSSFTTDVPPIASTSSDVTTGSMSSEDDDVTTSKSPDDESSISVEELFNDDDSKSSAKIDRLLSDDKTTDALAKEIANLLTDDPANSSENPKASPNDLAIITDDAPIEQKTSWPVTEMTPVSSEEAVSSAQESSPLTVSSATQQCVAKRELGSTECSLSMICCSACCPLDTCPLKDIFKKDEIPDDCNCKRQVVCPGLPNPSPVIPFHSPPPPHTGFVTFAVRPTSLVWSHDITGVLPPTTPNLLPGLVPPTHPAVFVGPAQQQTPTLIRHPGFPYQIAQPALSPLDINYHWPPHVIPHNPGFPPLFGPPMYHRPPTYTHPIHPHLPFMHPQTPFMHPHTPFMHPHTPFMHPHTPFMHPHTPFMHPHTPFMHPHTPFMHPHTPFMHPHTPFMHPHTPFMHPHTPFMHPHTPFMHPHPIMHPPIFHPPFMHPHPPIMHPHPPIFHPAPIHFHPPHHHVPVVIHPPPQPVVVHPPPTPPPKPKPTSPPKPKPIPAPKPKGPPGPSYSGSDATAAQGNSPGAPAGLPPLVVVGTSKKKSNFPLWTKHFNSRLKQG